MKNTIFPEIVKQMKDKNETLEDMTKLLGLTNVSQVSKRLSGSTEWTIGEAEILCNHYNLGMWELFKRKEN